MRLTARLLPITLPRQLIPSKQHIMIKRYTILALLLSVGWTMVVNAARYETVSSGTYSWKDPDAWVGGVVPPRDIRNRDTIIINTEVVLMTSLGLKPGAYMEVNDRLIVYNPNGSSLVDNKGDIQINGLVRILPGVNGLPNSLVHSRGEFIINGTLENIGAVFVNEKEIYVNASGTLRNYGYRDAMDDLLIRANNEDIYNLYVYGADLFGYYLDPGSLIGGIGGPLGGGPDPDSIDYGALVWTCLAGSLENNGDIFLRDGGIFDQDDCGGGIVDGNGEIIEDAACTAPENLRVTGTNHGSGLTFRWNEVPAALGYYTAFKPEGSARYRLTRPVMGGATSISFPRNFFPSGTRIEWAVVSVCSAGELDLNLMTTALPVQGRESSVLLDEYIQVSVFPNPVSEQLYLESSTGDLVGGTLSILDINGRMVLEQRITANGADARLSVHLGDLDEGLYLLRINSGKAVHQESLLVSR